MGRLDNLLFKLRPANLQEGLRRFARFWYLRLVRIEASPHTIALGLAMGVFAGLLPILPFQTVAAVALAFIVRGSKIAAALGTWITNPLNWVPFYMLCYYIGRVVVPFTIPPFDPTQLEMTQMLDLGWKFFAVMMAGGLIMAVPGTIVTYMLTHKGMELYRKRKQERAALKRQNG
ncbi:MAG: DUF2062 domain-containing protein [Deltaproteobacteria bacterium]|jgi:uncharacterized protein (DUF2062 family)|nr:DUF2062 domain-containing protein [Deltaproteobacteria bacterium]